MRQYSTTKSEDVLAFGPLAGRGSSGFLRLRWQVFKGSSMGFGFSGFQSSLVGIPGTMTHRFPKSSSGHATVRPSPSPVSCAQIQFNHVDGDRHSHGNWFIMAPGPFLPPKLENCAASSTSTVELHLVDLYGKLRHVSIPLILWVWFTPQKSNIDTKHEGVMLGINPMVSIAADS